MKEGVMIFLNGFLIAQAAFAPLPETTEDSSNHEVIRVTTEMMVGIADDLMEADIAEVDIDPAVFDIPSQSKPRKKSALDEVEFISEADKPARKLQLKQE